MTLISQNEINEVRNAASIVDVISSYVPLTPQGKNYFGVCPFHNDHSPSMSVSPEKQIYTCFSCGATGNVFTFIENYLNVSFSEAVLTVAKSVGISMKADIAPKPLKKYTKEYEILDFVLKLYQNNLNTVAGEKAKKYLEKRGLLEDTIKDFDIGLSFDRDMLYSLLSKKDYSVDMLQGLGLINASGTHIYDVFQNRIVFPIHNLEGEVVGFTARCYLEDATPKYLNTKETVVFKKGHILFNYHRAKNQIRLLKQVVLVEGNMDAIRLYSSGIKNVVALMGTSFTKEQLEAVKKLRAKVILMLDNDNAGEEATLSVGSVLEENDISFGVVRLSGAKDPDEYVLKYGTDAMQENIHSAISFVDFKLNYYKKNKNLNDAAELSGYLKAVIDSLKNNSDELLKEVTLQKLANDYNISYATLKEQLDKTSPKKRMDVEKNAEVVEATRNSYERMCDYILYYMMNGMDYVKLYQTRLGVFPTKEHRLVANEILYYSETSKEINLADFITYASTTNLKERVLEIISECRGSVLSSDAFLGLIKKVKRKIKEEEIKKLKKEQANITDINQKTKLAEKILELKKGSVEDESY